jgi:YidC/Oxa1 family membrane protein insertase
MYDRKTWIVLAICGVLLALNIHFTGKAQRERIEYERRLAAAKELEQKQNPPAQPAPADPAATTGAELTVETPPPPTEEETIILESDNVVFTFTNIGGGIKFAEFKNQFEVGSRTAPVRINRFGGGPIGAIASASRSLENLPYAYNAEQSEPGRSVVYIAKLPSGLIAKKIFTLVQTDEPGAPYFLDFELKLENSTTTAVNLKDWSLYLGEASPLYQKETITHTGFFWREDGDFTFKKVTSFSGGWFSSERSVINSKPALPIEFAGVSNQFFATVIKPGEITPSSVWGKAGSVSLRGDAPPVQSIRAGLHLPDVKIDAGEQRSLSYRIFIGPKHNPMLRRMGGGWGDVMEYGMFWWVSRPLNWLLNTLHNLFDGVSKNWSWGLAIIFLTIIVRICIWPLHAKSTRTMKRMSKLQPEMAKLKEKYPNDPNKLNTEMMGLYRKYGINPLGGCLPMLLQMPIFFGFFTMLQSAVELRNQQFLWVADLSQPDTLTHLAGIPINILPIVMGITSFLQILVTPKTGDKMQQRIILFMPLIFFFFCYNFASALALYWTVQNIFSIGQTWLMNKMPEPELKAATSGGKKSWVERMAEKQAELQRLQKERLANGGSTSGMRDVTPPDTKKKRPPRTGG